VWFDMLQNAAGAQDNFVRGQKRNRQDLAVTSRHEAILERVKGSIVDGEARRVWPRQEEGCLNKVGAKDRWRREEPGKLRLGQCCPRWEKLHGPSHDSNLRRRHRPYFRKSMLKIVLSTY
jgi:hypothetical protein